MERTHKHIHISNLFATVVVTAEKQITLCKCVCVYSTDVDVCIRTDFFSLKRAKWQNTRRKERLVCTQTHSLNTSPSATGNMLFRHFILGRGTMLWMHWRLSAHVSNVDLNLDWADDGYIVRYFISSNVMLIFNSWVRLLLQINKSYLIV